MPPFNSSKSILESFLTEIVASIRGKNGQRIAELIQLDFDSLSPERQKPYAELNAELNTRFPASSNDSALVTRCKSAISQDEFGSFSSPFSDSVVHYFRYLRDFTTADNRGKASKIRQLTSQCVTALGDSKYGVIMIPIVLSFSRVLATIATNLDRSQQHQQQQSQSTSSDNTPGNKVSFVEDAANVLRDAFIKCLAGSPGVPRTSRPSPPDDKRLGIYLTANSCLKLLTQCGKLRNAQQMFSSIDAQSPPLAFYPAAQRVTYLYHLGRYHFANSHFIRAAASLQAAYAQCHAKATTHRRVILTYLIAANICVGRFPSRQGLLSRPEAAPLADRFLPLCQAIRTGDLGAFHRLTNLASESGRWFLRRAILLQLQDRCEILVWRSLVRQTFRIAGFHGEEKKVPFLRLPYVQHAARWSVARAQGGGGQRGGFGAGFFSASSTAPNPISQNPGEEDEYIDPELEGISAAIAETGFDIATGTYNDEMIGSASLTHRDSYLHVPTEQWPSMAEVESMILSLIQQHLLRGFALHTTPRFAIPGSQKLGGPMKAGFPPVWAVIAARMGVDVTLDGRPGSGRVSAMGGIEVPGWVEERSLEAAGGGGGGAGGGVVRIFGARPAGS